MICRVCGNKVSDGEEFCLYCGAPLDQSEEKENPSLERLKSKYCSNCGKELLAESAFCDHCGKAIGADGKNYKFDRYCPNCGSGALKTDKYCRYCGDRLPDSSSNGLLKEAVPIGLLFALMLTVGIGIGRNLMNGATESMEGSGRGGGKSYPQSTSSPSDSNAVSDPAAMPTVTLTAESSATSLSTTTSIATLTPIPTPTPTPTPTPVSNPKTNTENEADAGETISIIGGIKASASDFVFPYSSQEYLDKDELDTLLASTKEEMRSKSQMAVNEIFARYGYTFATSANPSSTGLEAKAKFEELDWYREAQKQCPSEDWEVIQKNYMNAVEVENIKRIDSWQMEHGVYY